MLANRWNSFCIRGPPATSIFLIRFSDQAQLLSPFTQDTARFRASSARSKPRAGPLSTIRSCWRRNQSRKAHNQRKVLLVISDGGDNNSRYSWER